MRETLQPLWRGALLVLLVLVAVLHLWILGGRVADGSVLEPGPAGRWLASVALAFFLRGLHRRGLSLVRGRGALVFWLLVLLLHGVGMAPAAAASVPAAMPAEVFFIATPLGIGLATLLWLGATFARRVRRPALGPPLRRSPALEAAGVPDLRLLTAVGPRAPPG